MIDEGLIETFERDGVVVLPQVLDAAQIERLIAAGDALVASDLQTMRQSKDDGAYDGFRNCISLDPAYMELLAHPTVLPYLVRLLGSDIQLLTSHLIHKQSEPPGATQNGHNPGWHRDFAKAMRTLGHARIPRLDLKCAFYLTDLQESGSGATMFVPGSHHLKEALAVPRDRDPEGAWEPKLRPGDCVLFENRTWHTAGRNICGRTRKVVMMGYTYTWIKPSDWETQPAAVVERAQAMYGDIGLQLLAALPQPVGFDFNYDSKPLRDWAAAHEIAPYTG